MDNQQNKLMPVGQLFSKSFEVYKDKFRILTKISALNFLAFVAFLPFVAIFIVLSISNRYNLTLFLSGILFLLIGILILIILGLWIYASLFFAAKEGNGQTKIKEIMPKSWKIFIGTRKYRRIYPFDNSWYNIFCLVFFFSVCICG